jgi:zinc/manganese transport system substrate-binding protein
VAKQKARKIMRNFPRIITLLALGIVCLSSFISPIQAQDRIMVVASTSILTELVRNVAWDKADFVAIVPPDGDTHSFQPTPEDIRRVTNADLILINGLQLEGFIDQLIQNSGTTAKVVTVTDGIPFYALSTLQAGDGTQPEILGIGGLDNCGSQPPCDPHLWQDPINVILYVLNIRDALIAADPTNADSYTTNAAVYIDQLKQLDAYIWTTLAILPPEKRILVTNHDSLGYFAARYHFKIGGVVLPGGASTEPTPQEVAALIDQIRALGVKAIFTENVENDKLARQIADQTGIQVVQSLYTDALGAPGTTGETYINMMRFNAETITASLQ